eukprot:scaffold310_cov168-Amphora_coffeaeformis.AAC.32
MSTRQSDVLSSRAKEVFLISWFALAKGLFCARARKGSKMQDRLPNDVSVFRKAAWRCSDSEMSLASECGSKIRSTMDFDSVAVISHHHSSFIIVSCY